VRFGASTIVQGRRADSLYFCKRACIHHWKDLAVGQRRRPVEPELRLELVGGDGEVFGLDEGSLWGLGFRNLKFGLRPQGSGGGVLGFACSVVLVEVSVGGGE